MSQLSIERMSLEQINAMAAHEQASALNEIAFSAADVGRQTVSARIALAQARNALIDAKDRRHDVSTALQNVELAKAQLDALKERARTLRELRSIFQTLLRAIPA